MKQKTPISGARLRIARKIAGLSLEDLSRKMGGLVTRQALFKYEQGRMIPSPDVLKCLSDVLDLRPRYGESPVALAPDCLVCESTHNYDEPAGLLYCRSDLVSDNNETFASPSPLLAPARLTTLEFRKSAPLPKKKEEALRAGAIEYLTRYEDLERMLGMTVQFENPIPDVSADTVEEIEKAATAVRDRWDLGLAPIANLLELLETRGIKVFEIRGLEGMEDFDGLAACSESGYVVALNMDWPVDRIRFTAAHELAHLVCGFDGEGEKERLCHVFAGALLLPKAVLERELFHHRRKITLWELASIKEKYGISLQAVMHRAFDLELIGPRHLRGFMETVRKNGWSITEPVAYKGREEAVRFKRLLNYAVAERVIGISQAALFAGLTESKFRKEIGAMM